MHISTNMPCYNRRNDDDDEYPCMQACDIWKVDRAVTVCGSLHALPILPSLLLPVQKG